MNTGWEYQWGDQTRKDHVFLLKKDRDEIEYRWNPVKKPINPPGRNNRDILWLRHEIPDIDSDSIAILINGKGILLSFKAYVEDRLIYSFGQLNSHGKGKLSGITSHLIDLREDAKGKTLTLKIFSDYPNIGIRGKVFVGSRSQLIHKVIQEDILKFSLSIFMIILGIIDLFVQRPERKQTGSISMFGVLSISLGLYTITLTTLKDFAYFAPVFWFNVYTTGLTLIPIGVIGFLWQVFRPIKNNYLYRIWQFHVFFAFICQVVFFSVLYGNVTMAFGSGMLNFLRIILIFEMFLMIGIAAKDAFIKNSLEAKIYLIGLIPIIFCATHDIFVGLDIFKTSNSYVPFGLIIFVLSLEFIQRIKNAQIQDRLFNYSRELEKKSKEKAALISDLHDGIGGLITNIKFLSEMGLKRSDKENMTKTLSSISALSSDSLIEIGSFMQSLDKNIDWDVIGQNLNALGVKMISALELSFTFEKVIANNAREPDSVMFLNLLRIYKEALTNIIKHAGAKSVYVKLDATPDHMSLLVQDDGTGFGGNIVKGRGLKSMKTRAQKLGGHLSIDSDKGTVVHLKLDFT